MLIERLPLDCVSRNLAYQLPCLINHSLSNRIVLR